MKTLNILEKERLHKENERISRRNERDYNLRTGSDD